MSRFGLSAFGSLSIIANLQLAEISKPFWVPCLKPPIWVICSVAFL